MVKTIEKDSYWKKHSIAVGILILLQFLIDMLYVILYPTVSPLRAAMIGATAFLLLWIPLLRRNVPLSPWLGFLPIYINALLGALAVQSGIVPSKSVLSALLHVGILIIVYSIITLIRRKKA